MTELDIIWLTAAADSYRLLNELGESSITDNDMAYTTRKLSEYVVNMICVMNEKKKGNRKNESS